MHKFKKIKLAIICSHPIQYYVPVFQVLAKDVILKVFYTAVKTNNYDPGFKRIVIWDLPLLDGYDYQFTQTSAAIREISKFNPQALLIYGWSPNNHLRIMMHFKNKLPVFFRGDSTTLNKGWFLKEILRTIILTFIYKHIDCALYVGTNNKTYFQKYGLQENQLRFVSHSIDNNRFAQPHPLNVRTKLDIKECDILILYAGKFEHVKNLALLIKVFKTLKIDHTHLLLVGDGALAKDLKSQSGHSTNIHFMNFQNQCTMPSVYQACDLYCLPSKSESWGLSINEAMAASKAILASDKVGSAVDLVNKSNGSIFKSGCAKDLEDKLRQLLTSKTELQKKGRCSYDIIQQFNFQAQVSNIIKALH